jgi:hypothetical protein
MRPEHGLDGPVLNHGDASHAFMVKGVGSLITSRRARRGDVLVETKLGAKFSGILGGQVGIKIGNGKPKLADAKSVVVNMG